MNRTALLVLRYGIGGAMVVAGIVLLITNTGGFGVDGFALGAGGGLSVILFNLLYRLGVSGDRERDEEQRARAFMERYGHWPDEVPDDQRAPSDRARKPATTDDERSDRREGKWSQSRP